MHQDNKPGQSYDVDDRRRAAALAACEGIPTEALERGIVQELYKLAATMTMHDKMAERKDGNVVVSEWIWDEHVRSAINRLNDTCEPGHTRRHVQ